MMLSGLKITPATRDGVLIVVIQGEVDVYSAPKARNAIKEQARATDLVLDLQGCTFLDSTGLGVIIGTLKNAKATGHYMAIACSREDILKIFRITGLRKVFDIHATADEAVAAVKARRASHVS